jgi:L-cysteine:1D-myo-inositol 2-amino-2-deoxy-alpha-D-glucopyranoside ligase
MPLSLYNSLTKKIEPFVPLKENEVSIYVCGITPDGPSHLGHAFTYITFDVLIRYLRFSGYKVNYLQNVTDIDDDMLARSKKADQNWKEFGDYWTSAFLKNMEALGWISPMPYVKATDSIPTIIKVVTELIEKGFAYVVDGTVYFDIQKFPEYGKLSGLSRDEMIKISAQRGADPKDPAKKNPLDFILWQAAKPGEPAWDSSWGKGRPGWHIECSSMIQDYLGDRIDIHGGGEDLIYPHHESEIAQSESFTGKAPFAKYFMHVVYLKYLGEKMSKSLGNLIEVSDLLKKYSPNAIRYLLLSHHYRESWEYKEKEMEEAGAKMELLETEAKKSSETGRVDENIINFLKNNLDTPAALEYLTSNEPGSLKSSLNLLGFTV